MHLVQTHAGLMISTSVSLGPLWPCLVDSVHHVLLVLLNFSGSRFWLNLKLVACSFVGFLTVRVEMSLNFLPALGTLSHLVGCLNQTWYEGLCLVSLYLVMAWFINMPGGLHFSEEKWRKSISRERGVG